MAATTGRLTRRSALVGLLGARARLSTLESAEARLGLLLAAPAIVTILLIAVIPLAQTILDSLFQISLKFENAPRPFVGVDNYRSVLGDDSWFNALRVTGLVAGASVAAELVLGMIIALLINRSFRGRGLVRASVLVPWALTTVVSAKMWAWIYDGRYGVANDLLMRLHVIDQPIIFLVRPELTIWAMVAAEIWKTTPFMALLLLAGLQLIPHDLYETAALDGASRADPGRPAMISARARARAKLYEGFGFYAFVAGFVIFCLAPFVWTLLTSLKGPTTIYAVPIRDR